jgi:Ca2+-binding RTX toxin-like protein
MSGGKGNDTQNGGDGADLIFANRGNDVTEGGDGNDTLWALSKFDVTGPGDPLGDALTGGDGNDTFRVRDGEIDLITCGDGNHDRVLADAWDVLTDATPADPLGSCERVVRGDPSSVSDQEENQTEEEPEDEREGS